MGVYQNLIYMWRFCLGSKTREEYISRDINHPIQMSHPKKSSAKKAILWLLSKAPHSTEEIADHYGISPKLVEFLLEELACENFITKEGGRPARFCLKENASIEK